MFMMLADDDNDGDDDDDDDGEPGVLVLLAVQIQMRVLVDLRHANHYDVYDVLKAYRLQDVLLCDV